MPPLGIMLAVAAVAMLVGEPAAAQGGPKAVVELFTSQGCSSCPPADALLKRYAERSDLIALTLPVDIWDHLGWKDTLASPKHTYRQKSYAKLLQGGNVYTPQVVVNGSTHVIGSLAGEIDKAIERTAPQLAASRIRLDARASAGKVVVDVGEGDAGASGAAGTLWLAVVMPRVDVEIKHGENRGRKNTYYNVVRELSAIGMWSGKALKVELPESSLMQPGERCAVVLQSEKSGRIVAASWMQ